MTFLDVRRVTQEALEVTEQRNPTPITAADLEPDDVRAIAMSTTLEQLEQLEEEQRAFIERGKSRSFTIEDVDHLEHLQKGVVFIFGILDQSKIRLLTGDILSSLQHTEQQNRLEQILRKWQKCDRKRFQEFQKRAAQALEGPISRPKKRKRPNAIGKRRKTQQMTDLQPPPRKLSRLKPYAKKRFQEMQLEARERFEDRQEQNLAAFVFKIDFFRNWTLACEPQVEGDAAMEMDPDDAAKEDINGESQDFTMQELNATLAKMDMDSTILGLEQEDGMEAKSS